jgi:NAD(P)-dependent dehydrogenase (short-subunit alcohol dehydrogenase family)
VTGGAGDLGFATCRALLEHGLRGLIIFDVNESEASTKAAQLDSEFPDAIVKHIIVDITVEEAVNKAVDDAVALVGPINILVNYAGVVSSYHALDMTVKEFRRTVDINTNGAFIISQAVGRQMVSAKISGSIVLVSSVSGHMVNFPQPQVGYNASKAAVKMITASLACEWAVHGIRINCISPGYMDTILNEGEGLEEGRKIWMSRNPMGRMGEREELCGVVILLVSRAGSYFQGADIVVDGGLSLF